VNVPSPREPESLELSFVPTLRALGAEDKAGLLDAPTCTSTHRISLSSQNLYLNSLFVGLTFARKLVKQPAVPFAVASVFQQQHLSLVQPETMRKQDRNFDAFKDKARRQAKPDQQAFSSFSSRRRSSDYGEPAVGAHSQPADALSSYNRRCIRCCAAVVLTLVAFLFHARCGRLSQCTPRQQRDHLCMHALL
jgi:hypothetical protein